MAEIVIIGAGLTGLSTAYHLEARGYTDYKIFEKETTVGGLCRSINQDGFTFDYTGHLLHINDDYFKKFITDIVGFDHFNTIDRRSFVYSNDTYTHYPFQVNLYGLPPHVIAECIEGFIQRPSGKKHDTTFKAWVLKNFGKGIAEHFFYPYQEKIFSYPVDKLSSSWTGRFVPQTSLTQMIQGAVQPPQAQKIGYNAQFFYPKQGGIFFWIQKLYEQIKQPIYTNKECIRVDLKEKIVFFSDGSFEPYKKLINTTPLNNFLTTLSQKKSYYFHKAAEKLLCNSVVNFNIGIQRDNLSDKHWIYYPEKKYPFYRIGFSHNFAPSMAPQGHSSLYGEFSHLQQPEHIVEKMLQESLKHTKKMFALTPHDIITEKIVTINHAYVIFDHWRDKNLPHLLTSLEQHNLYSIGRYGAWKYSSMQEGLLEGKSIAERFTL